MITTEQWTRWEPIKGLSRKYYIDSTSDGIEGFIIILSDVENRKKRVRISFEYSVHAYRNTNESFTNQIICDLDAKYGTEFYGDWTFFKVTNSEYLQWLSEKSCGWSDACGGFTHFSILSVEYILDIIDSTEPTVEFIDE